MDDYHFHCFHKCNTEFFKNASMAIQFPSPSLFGWGSTIKIKLQPKNQIKRIISTRKKLD